MINEVDRQPTFSESLQWAISQLTGQVPSPEADAENLLTHVTGLSRTHLYAAPGASITDAQNSAFRLAVQRRLKQEPVQYITGKQAFRGLDLAVGPGVLVPRPETEFLAERCLALLQEHKAPKVLDVGTGSAAIALSIEQERPDSQVWATEISASALQWAMRNLQAYSSTVRLLRGDLFQPLPASLRHSFDLIVSNPPYLTARDLELTAPDVRDHEPVGALISGSNGLAITRRLIEEARGWLARPGWLVVETSEDRAEDVKEAMTQCYEDVGVGRDLAGRPRMVEGRNR